MTFLPVADRELRVASRKRSTPRLRVWAAVVALVIAAGFMAFAAVGLPGLGAATLGRVLLGVLTWLAFAGALLSGLFFTSDCVSEEKREGTLGLLFLTDLRGYDIVAGKLVSSSLRCVYGLLAIFPILALTLTMGGVTGVQFWKSLLALLNALMVSLAAGLFVSVLSRDSQKALLGTLLLILGVLAIGPAADVAIERFTGRRAVTTVGLASPALLMAAANSWAGIPFWTSLAANQAVVWLLLGMTCVLVPRTWQSKPARTGPALTSLGRWWRFGSAARRDKLRRDLADRNPVLWLSCRERWQAATVWLLAFAMAGTFLMAFRQGNSPIGWIFWSAVSGLFTLALYLGMASQSVRFFSEARRSGLIELMLATPMTARQIVQGQLRALGRMFGLPLLLCLAVMLAGGTLMQLTTWNQFTAAIPAPAPVPPTNAPATGPVSVTVTPALQAFGTPPPAWIAIVISASAVAALGANLLALAWFGMWAGLTAKTANLATLKTLLFVQVIPWFVMSFAAGLLMPLLILPNLMRGAPPDPSAFIYWFPLLTSGVSMCLAVAKDVFFIVWSRRKLYSEFRDKASQPLATRPPAIPAAPGTSPSLPPALPPSPKPANS